MSSQGPWVLAIDPRAVKPHSGKCKKIPIFCATGLDQRTSPWVLQSRHIVLKDQLKIASLQKELLSLRTV